MFKQHCVFYWLVLVALAFAAGVNAQVSTSTITGVVTDTSGSVVPGAHVRVTDESTGLARETNSNHAGIFVVPQLALGKYRVEVEATGFKKAVLEHVECNLEQVLSLNFKLEVGQVNESLTVTAAPPMIATDTTSLGNLRYLQQMQYLPENARGLTQLLGFSAGVVKDVSDNTAQTPFAGHVFMAASAPDNTAWVFDGTWGNTPLGGNGNIVPLDGRLFEQNTPNLESIAEFKVSTANNKAESQMAYTVSVATKSGTNELHGSAFEYNRVGAESARSFFSPTREALTRNQYGGSLGGPVYFPHLYSGHNRTFFFASYEGFRDYRTVATTGTLPNTQEVAGDLSAILNKIALRDPLGGVFPNNVIPASRITAVSKGLLKYVPTPIGNQSASTPIPFNFVSDKPVIDRDWKYDVKLDHRFSDKDSVSGRFTDSSGFQDNLNTSPLPGQFGQGYQYTWGQQLSVTENHIFSPTSLNELRLGYYRKRRFQSYVID